MLGNLFKTLANSCYGRFLVNVANYKQIEYADPKKAKQLMNEPRFQKLTELSDSVSEVEMDRKNLIWRLPLQVGLFILDYAKLHMLRFHYEMINKFVPPSEIQLLYEDTDSAWFAHTASDLQNLIPRPLRQTFFEEYHLWFPAPCCERHHNDFVRHGVKKQKWDPSKCDECIKSYHYNRRTLGLFKVEFSGDIFIGLCSKTYFCQGGTECKISSKGINKNQNELTRDKYEQVLQSQESGEGVNRGFVSIGKDVFTYSQQRKSLSYFYIKRLVHDDGITTSPTEA